MCVNTRRVDPVSIGIGLYYLYKTYRVGKKALDWNDIRERIQSLEAAYDGLPDKRRKPGPAFRKALDKLREAFDKKSESLAWTAIDFIGGDSDIAEVVSN